jgi:hypothetical protein
LYGAKQAPACFKKVLVDFMLQQGFVAANDANTVFIKREGASILINACFVDDVLHLTNDSKFYRTFRKEFEKRFDLKASDHVDLYLGNRIIVDKSKSTVSISQKHYILSCLEKFGLSNCNGKNTPLTSRLTTANQPTVVDEADQTLYCAMVGSLLYIALWTRVDISYAVSELSLFVSIPGSRISKQPRVYFGI